MYKMKNFFSCLKFCNSKSLMILAIILMIFSTISNSYIIIVSSKIINTFGSSDVYKYLLLSSSLFLVKIILNNLVAYINKINYIGTKLSITSILLKNWFKQTETQRSKLQTGEINQMIENDISQISIIATHSLGDVIKLIFSILINISIIGIINLALLPIILVFVVIDFLKLQRVLYKKRDKLEKANNESLKEVNTWLLGIHERFDYLKIYGLNE